MLICLVLTVNAQVEYFSETQKLCSLEEYTNDSCQVKHDLTSIFIDTANAVIIIGDEEFKNSYEIIAISEGLTGVKEMVHYAVVHESGTKCSIMHHKNLKEISLIPTSIPNDKVMIFMISEAGLLKNED